MYFSQNYFVWAMVISTCVPAFAQSLNTTTPKWKNEKSDGTNPGLAFIPVPAEKDSTLIWLKNRNYKQFYENIMTHLDVYYEPHKIETKNFTLQKCSLTNPPSQNKGCSVDINEWGPCNRESYFQYHRDSPCVFLKLQTIDGWVPEYYNDPQDLPEEMPVQLGDYIRSIRQPEERNQVWITCRGEYPVDIEYLGPIDYYPGQGFPSYYYPYKKSKGYLSPVIAVQFKRPSYGVVVKIECRAWAKNIKYNNTDGNGYVHFELLVE